MHYLTAKMLSFLSFLALYLFVRVLRVGEDRRLRKFYREPGEPVLDAARSQYPVKLAGFWTIQVEYMYVYIDIVLHL